jgi:hypothetical protein
MTTSTSRISFFRGDSHTITVYVKQRDNAGVLQAIDLTNAVAVLSVKERGTATEYVLQTDCSVVTPVSGVLEVAFTPEDTQNLKPGLYVYDVQVTLANQKVYTVVKDQLEIKEDVTRPVTGTP